MKTLYVTNRKKWRSWLSKNHKKEKEVWLLYYKKAAGKPRIPYSDAVEEALCYGWIDGKLKGINENKFVQRFTPRLKTSNLSVLNEERIRKLIKQKKMTKAGLEAVAHAFDSKKTQKRVAIPPDILSALKANKEAWKNFQKFPDSYKRIRIAYITSQGKHSKESYQRALRYFIKMTAKNKKIGMLP